MSLQSSSADVEWTITAPVATAAILNHLRDTVAAYGHVESIEFSLSGGDASTAAALRTRDDVLNVSYDEYF